MQTDTLSNRAKIQNKISSRAHISKISLITFRNILPFPVDQEMPQFVKQTLGEHWANLTRTLGTA